jgi:aromatic ring-opening dioxygenase catalytic subunit (LigB family)
MPVVFVAHGGGPWPFVPGLGEPEELAALTAHLRGVRDLLPVKPRALLVISAHWEAPVPTVTTSAQPPMLYDYYGFPPETYEVQWNAPGDLALADRTRALLDAAGFRTAGDPARGYDHGTFVPLSVTYPEAELPTVQLSLMQGLDPKAHLALGRALAPLRDEGVLIIGSGMTFHNMRAFGDPRAKSNADAFDAWLSEAARAEPQVRDRLLEQWNHAPAARLAHPREEHLLPLMVIAGAAGSDRGARTYSGTLFGMTVAGYAFGAPSAEENQS